jgi:hypothetical protein
VKVLDKKVDFLVFVRKYRDYLEILKTGTKLLGGMQLSLIYFRAQTLIVS